MLGEHTDLVPAELGYNTAIVALRQSGIILADMHHEPGEQALFGRSASWHTDAVPNCYMRWRFAEVVRCPIHGGNANSSCVPTSSWNHVWVASLVRANFGWRIA
jgi:hypothetical protein